MGQHDTKFVRIAIGEAKPNRNHQNLGKVKNTAMPWIKLREMLGKPHETPEKFKDYLALSKEGQDRLKSSNGFWIGCRCLNNSRRRVNLQPRDCITLDCDTISIAGFEAIRDGTSKLGAYEYFWHTTRKHTAAKPRIRIVIPTKTEIAVDDYEPVSRITAWVFNRDMTWVDDVSFRPAQMMFKPTISSDGAWASGHNEGKLVDPEAILDVWRVKLGLDPFDYSTLPIDPTKTQARRTAAKVEDPLEKPGIIGAWNRVFPFSRLFEEVLSDFYEPGDASSEQPRYSFKGGSSSNGLVVYDDDTSATSHHGTDPLSGGTYNSWDAARTCLYGDLDADLGEDSTVSMSQRPSFKAMQAFAQSFKEVQEDMLERALNPDEAFDEEEDDGEFDEGEAHLPSNSHSPRGDGEDDDFLGPVSTALDADDLALLGGLPSSRTVLEGEIIPPPKPKTPPEGWRSMLDVDLKTTEINNKLPNCLLIMKFHKPWFGKLRFNELMDRAAIARPIRFKGRFWNNVEVLDPRNGTPVTDDVASIFRVVMEASPKNGGYGLNSVPDRNLYEAIEGAARADSYHPIKDFLGPTCRWDGKERLATMLQRYLGAEDNEYTRQVFTLMMIAVVARTYEPGHKFDNAMILQGLQGSGKSTFIRAMGRVEWYGLFDIGFDDVAKAVEKMRGKAVMELGELAGFNKGEMEDAKQFMSAHESVVRLAWAHQEKTFLRRCIFVGSTNDPTPLRDATGNRRWWVVQCKNEEESGIHDLPALMAEMDQCWHEARHLYDLMRIAQPHGDLPLMLKGEARVGMAEAAERSLKETEFSLIADMIEAWADTPVPLSDFLHGDGELSSDPSQERLVVRTRISPIEVWTECLEKNSQFFTDNAWKIDNAFKILGRRWPKMEKRTMIGGTRAKWHYRAGSTDVEIKNGFREVDQDVIG